MRNFKIGVKFDIKHLKNLKNDTNSGVEIHNKKHHLALHPIYLNDFNKSIKDVLSAGIAKYNKNLGGILLGYENIKLPVDIGLINYDSCYIHMDLQADFFVFKPEIDKELQGVVNRKSKDHVGVLVYNVFNVSLPQPRTGEDWLGSTVNNGDEVLFRITYMDLSSYLPYIKGELISIVSTATVNNDDDKYLMNHKKRVNKKINFDNEQSLEDEKEYVGKSSENKNKKNKKRKFDSSEETAQDHVSLSQVQKKRKGKSKSKLAENGQEEQILEPQVQKMKKHKGERKLEERTVSPVQKKKKHKGDSVLEETVLEEQISAPQIEKKKKKKAKEESLLEESVPEQQILAPQVKKKKKKHKEGSVLEENALEEQISESLAQKTKKQKNESETDEDTRTQKKSKIKKEKIRKEKGVDDATLTDYNLSRLFNVTKVSVKNMKTEIDSDENLKDSKSGQWRYFKTPTISQETYCQNMKEKKTKRKKENLWEEVDQLPCEVDKTKRGHSGNDSDGSIISSKSRKSNKRRHSFIELDHPDRNWKRECA